MVELLLTRSSLSSLFLRLSCPRLVSAFARRNPFLPPILLMCSVDVGATEEGLCKFQLISIHPAKEGFLSFDMDFPSKCVLRLLQHLNSHLISIPIHLMAISLRSRAGGVRKDKNPLGKYEKLLVIMTCPGTIILFQAATLLANLGQ